MTILDQYLAGDRVGFLDVGARGGIDARWARFASVLEVTAFEPDSAECARLNAAAGALPYRVRFLPHALWRETSDEVPFHVSIWPVASSIYPRNEAFLSSFPLAQSLLAVKEVQTISTLSLDDVSSEQDLTVDCLKIDVEGAELDVLRGGEKTMRSSLVLEVEVELNPIFRGQPLFGQVDSHLRERGWELLGLRRSSWRRGAALGGAGLDPEATGDGGQIVQADALYWNVEAVDAGLSLARELKLLVVLAAYRQSDLVLIRLRDPSALTRGLPAAEMSALEAILVPRPGPIRRLARRALRRLDAQTRRRLANALEPGDATVWNDPDFF